MEDNKKSSQVAGTTSEVINLFRTGKITANQIREQRGLSKSNDPKSDMLFQKINEGES